MKSAGTRRVAAVVAWVCCCIGVAGGSAEAQQTLRDARAGFRTTIVPNAYQSAGPVDEPPASSPYVLVKFPSPAGQLAAYLTPDKKDGKKRPAIVWAHGGFGGIGSYYYSPQPASNDQTPKAYLDAGFVVMIPSWRGENENPGRFELFYGEVDDAVAAVEYLAALPHVDANRIYMAGHSTGGTIALLAALSTDKLRAAISFGGAPDIGRVVGDGTGYGNTPYDLKDERESRLRSAIHFVETLKTPTWYFEGAQSSYVNEAREMQRRAHRAKVPFHAQIIEGGTHFNILSPINALLAEKLLADAGPTCNVAIAATEVTAVFEKAQAAARTRRAKLPLVTLTPAAAARIKQAMAADKFDSRTAYLLMGVDGGLNITSDEPKPSQYDLVTSQGIRIAVRKTMAADVRGTTIDFDEAAGGFNIAQADQ